VFEVFHSFDWKISSFVTFTSSNIRSIQEWLFEYSLRFSKITELFETIVHVVHECISILIKDESIIPYSQALMGP
jgi:hypothetical protein